MELSSRTTYYGILNEIWVHENVSSRYLFSRYIKSNSETENVEYENEKKNQHSKLTTSKVRCFKFISQTNKN